MANPSASSRSLGSGKIWLPVTKSSSCAVMRSVSAIHRVHAAGEGRVRHDPAATNRRDKVIFRDNAVAVLHQENQYVEYLRLHCNRFGAAAQLTPVCVKRVIGKDKLHVENPR